MATVRVGSARIDERGKAYGGKAGDQTGCELSTQKWYLHKKGWRVFRAVKREQALKIAADMEAACKNSHIGYDQWQRNTLYKAAEPMGFDCGKVKTDCETDCSALVRVCCAYAGIMGLPSDFRTGNMPKNLLATGMFVELRGAKYTDQSAYLGKGDILVTKTHGHTVVVLDDGAKYEGAVEAKDYALGERLLKHGAEGADVKQLQRYLIQLDYDLGRWGADGEFGDATELAVKAFQKDKGLDADGQYGKKTHAALIAAAALWAMEALRRMQIPLPLAALCAGAAGYLLGEALQSDYFGPGVLTVLVFALCRQWHIGRLPELAAMLVINGWLLPSADMTLWGVTLPVELLATAALLPIWLYRGRQGPHGPWLRWVWYGFYPAHLLVLWLIDTKTC